jgi:hypothetical protein
VRLLELFEDATTVWYHGTPELQKFTRFENRTLSVSYLTDPKRWKAIQSKLSQMPIMAGQERPPEYWKLLDEVSKLNQYKQVRSPVFLSNTRSVANTYADYRRAYDSQAAEPGVIPVRVRPGKTLVINGRGESFRGISIESVQRGLASAGIPQDQINLALAQFAHQTRGDGDRISTDSLAAIVDDFGFDIVDVVNIKDNYMGQGPAATVRMVMSPELIDVIRNEMVESSLEWGGCWVKPNGEVLHLVPSPSAPIHHAELVFDDPELDAIVDQRIEDEDGDDYRETAVEVALEHGWIRVRTHQRGSGEIVVQFERLPTRQAKRELRDYITVHRNAGRFYINDQQFNSAEEMVRALG